MLRPLFPRTRADYARNTTSIKTSARVLNERQGLTVCLPAPPPPPPGGGGGGGGEGGGAGSNGGSPGGGNGGSPCGGHAPPPSPCGGGEGGGAGSNGGGYGGHGGGRDAANWRRMVDVHHEVAEAVGLEIGGFGLEREDTLRDFRETEQASSSSDSSLDDAQNGGFLDVASHHSSTLSESSSETKLGVPWRIRRCAYGTKTVHETVCATSCDCDQCKSDSCDSEAECCPGYKPYKGKKTNCVPKCDASRHPCSNKGKCIEVDTIKGHRCECKTGYGGEKCEHLVADNCASDPCKNGGTCIDLATRYICRCEKNYSGQNCETRVEVAVNCEDSNPCLNGGNCTQIYPGAPRKCDCPNSYQGRICEQDVNECSEDPGRCGAHGYCQNIVGSYKEETVCDRGNMCLHPNATCMDIGGGDFECSDCPDGYGGKRCDILKELSTDSCNPNPCARGGTCIREKQGSFRCRFVIKAKSSMLLIVVNISFHFSIFFSCARGWRGPLCDERDPSLCLSLACVHGSCIVDDDLTTGKSTAKCICDPGYKGDACTIKISLCDENPCKNAGITPCQQIGGDNYFCTCTGNFTGKNCDIPHNSTMTDCDAEPCQNGGNCTVINNRSDFKCECPTGYDGRLCSHPILDCASQPCQHGLCVDKLAGYTCECYKGYTGMRCEKWEVYNKILKKDGKNDTSDINSKSLTSLSAPPCVHGTLLYDIHEKPFCRCVQHGNFMASGASCDILKPLCEDNHCLNCGKCRVFNDSISCDCPLLTNGSRCEVIADDVEVEGGCPRRKEKTDGGTVENNAKFASLD
eukprot:UC4_evm1s1335